MPGLAVSLGQWPSLPRRLCQALINADGTIAVRRGPGLLGSFHSGAGVYILTVSVPVFGDLALIDIQATPTVSLPGTDKRILSVRVESANTIAVGINTEAGVATDTAFYIVFGK